MSKKIIGRDGPVIGIATSDDLFQKLKRNSSNLCSGWHDYDAFDFLVTSWHLFHDWPRSDPPDAISRKKRQKAKLPNEMILVLDILRDLVNGSKHFQLDLSAAGKRRVDEIHNGEEVGWYEYFFHEDLPGVTVGDHWYFSIRVLHNIIMSYFDWVFDDSTPVRDFPADLLDAILYCNIADRRSGESPRIWLKHIDEAYSKS